MIEREKINKIVKKIEYKEINYVDAIEDLDDLCNQKERYAIYKKALLILKAAGYPYDLENAINLLTLSSFLGCLEATFQLALIFYRKRKFELAERYFLKSIKIKESLYYLGFMEEKGLGKPRSTHRAFEYYLKGAKMNEFECCYKIGYFYLRGIGIKRNLEKGKKYLEIALKHKVNDTENIYKTFLSEHIS